LDDLNTMRKEKSFHDPMHWMMQEVRKIVLYLNSNTDEKSLQVME